MPTILTTQALPNNTYVITAAFTDEDGDAVTPESPLTWTMKDFAGTVVNSREDIALTPASSVDIVLSGDDLQALGADDNGIRDVFIEGTYDSDVGAGLSLNNSIRFVVDTLLPVSLQEAKDHMNIHNDNTDFDVDIALKLTAARERVEKFLHRKLITQTVTKYFDAWPEGDFWELPYGKLQSVTSIKYTDTDGDQSTMDSADYIVDTASDPGKVVLAYGESWPSVSLYPSNPIEIIFACGYGDDAGDVPEMIRAAIKIMTKDLFQGRGTLIIGTISSKLKTDNALLWPHRLWI